MATDARTSILANIRATQSGAVATAQRAPVFPAITDPLQRFLEECKANLTEVVITSGRAGSAAALQEIVGSHDALYAEDAPEVRALIDASGRMEVLWSSSRAIPESMQVALTMADAFVAQTGSILTSSRHGGRAASAAPATHVVYGFTSQLLPDLDAAMALISRQRQFDTCSFIGLISGSSRTADIEKILVQGAHGPRRLVVILEAR